MKIFNLFFIATFLLSCKSHQNKTKQISFPLENTMFQNKESELSTINTNLYSIHQNETTLVIFNGKKISLKKLNLLKQEIDSTFRVKIFKDKVHLKKYNVDKKYKTLILINKS